MILKQIIGSGARGLISYLSQASKNAHNHTQPFFTNMAGRSPRELAAEIAALRKLRPALKKAVAHLILSNDPRDRKLTETEWRHAVQIALKGIGAEEAAFAAYWHMDTDHDHIHVFFYGSLQTTKSSVTAITSKRMRQQLAKLKRNST